MEVTTTCRMFMFTKLLLNGGLKNICVGKFFQFPIQTKLEEIPFDCRKTTVLVSVGSVQITVKPFCKYILVCDQCCALGHLGDHH